MTPAELRKRRRDMLLTQRQLAECLGVTSNTVARWERGEVVYPPFLMLALDAVESLIQ